MSATFLITVLLGMFLIVGFSAALTYAFAEARWHKHPLARYSYQRAASFAASH